MPHKKLLIIIVAGLVVVGWFGYQTLGNKQVVIPQENISLTVLFARHLRSNDIPSSLLKNEISKADVILIESPAWNSVAEEGFNAISKGEKTASQLLDEWEIPREQQEGDEWQFVKNLANNFYGSGAFISSIDVTQDHPLSKKITETVTAFPKGEGKNFDVALQDHKDWFVAFTDLTRQRQDMMVDKYSQLVKDIEKGKIPQLEGKSEVKILYILGSNHIRFADVLEKKGYILTRKFSSEPFLREYSSEVTLMLLDRKAVSDDLYARSLFADQIDRLFGQNWLSDYQKMTRLQRKIISTLSFEEIKSIFNSMVGSSNLANTFANKFLSVMREKNISIPLTKTEFDSYSI